MYEETCCYYQIAKNEHESFKVVGSSLLQGQQNKLLKTIHDKHGYLQGKLKQFNCWKLKSFHILSFEKLFLGKNCFQGYGNLRCSHPNMFNSHHYQDQIGGGLYKIVFFWYLQSHKDAAICTYVSKRPIFWNSKPAT